jgi:multicomponent Na+:H+ antiporter subunit G
MIVLQNSLSVLLILLGLGTMFVGSLGIIRLPDFFARTHAASKVDTVGIILVLSGMAVHEGLTLTGGKLVLTIVFVALTNPVAVHILARAALRFGLKPWRKPTVGKEGEA